MENQHSAEPQQSSSSSASLWESLANQHEQRHLEEAHQARERPTWSEAVKGFQGTRKRQPVFLNKDGTFDPLTAPDDPLGPMPSYMHSRPTFFQKISHDPIYVPLIMGMTFSMVRGVRDRIKASGTNGTPFFLARVAFGGAIIATYCYSKARDQGALLPYIKPKPYFL